MSEKLPASASATEEEDPRRDAASMTVLEHIAELRATLLRAFGLAAVAAILAWFFSDAIVNALLRPAQEAGQETLYFSAPMEAFLLKLKASAIVGLFLVLPLVLHQIYRFVMPGLLPREKRVVTPLLVAATSLFYLGVAFCFFVLLPMVVRFMLSFATESLQPWITANSYFDMAARLCLAFGLLFELPMVVFALSWVGVVNPRTLLRGWRYALVLILAVSAALTPPDVISQVMLAGPVMVLYLGSVLLSMLIRRRRHRQEPDPEDSADDGPPEPPDTPSSPAGGGGDDSPVPAEGPDLTGPGEGEAYRADEAAPRLRPAEGAQPRGPAGAGPESEPEGPEGPGQAD